MTTRSFCFTSWKLFTAILGCAGGLAVAKEQPVRLKDVTVIGHYVNPLNRDFHLDSHAAFGFTWGFSGNTGETNQLRDANDGKKDPCGNANGSGLGGVKRHPVSRIKATPGFTHPGWIEGQLRVVPRVASRSLSR